jgi:hypothetical protein|tara:strand:+ start:675 stop:935 length:261 start_codon:yes stop_codon:yes gene_type:complete
MIIKKGKCLNDNQVAQFVDGCLKDDGSVIAHLNSCIQCFDLTTAVMNFVSENPELCQELDNAWDLRYAMAHRSLKSPSNERKQVKV